MDSGLKQRLLGATVLIALAIIFVPMFLGNSPPKETSATQNMEIPQTPERKFETRTLPIDASAPQKPAAPSAPPANPDKIVTVDTKAPATFESPEPKSVAVTPAEPKPADKAQPAQGTSPKAAVASAKDDGKAAAPAKPAVAEAQPASVPVAAATGRFSVNLGIYVDQGHADALVA